MPGPAEEPRKRFTSDDEAKKWLKRHLRISLAKFAKLWKQLVKDDWVRLAVDGEYSRAEFLTEARKRLRNAEEIHRADRRHARTKGSAHQIGLNAGELLRAWASSTYVARMAGLRSDVVEFRKEFLNGHALAAHEAQKYIEAAASVLIPQLPENAFSRQSLGRVPSHTKPGSLVLYKGHFPNSSGLPMFEDTFRQELDRTFHPTLIVWAKDPPENPTTLVLHTNPGSELDRLRVLTQRLMKRYSWDEHDASWFILTGQAPFIAPISLRGRMTSLIERAGSGTSSRILFTRPTTITIEIQPWMSGKAVAREYSRFRREYFQMGNHLKKPKTLKLLIFVNELYCERGEGLSWPEITKAWNAEHRDRSGFQYGDYRSLRQTYTRAVEAIRFPGGRGPQGLD